MNIIKNDKVNIVSAMNAEVSELSGVKGSYFTHVLKIKHSPLSSNADCKRVNDLVRSHYDTLSDCELSEDTYKLERGGVDGDGEGGWSNQWIIEDMKYHKNDIADNQVFVLFFMRLSGAEFYE